MAKKVSIPCDDSAYPEDLAATQAQKRAILSVKEAANICQGYIAELRRSERYNEDNPIAREALFDTVREVLAQETQVGNSTRFHNFAVLLGGNGFDSLACDVLDCGLLRFPMNVDLLADYLIYGIDCERWEQCAAHFATLESIEYPEWTWRCFTFGISYMNKLRDSLATTAEERNFCKKKAAELARAYKKYLPYEEGGYREMAKLLEKKPDAMLKTLDEALSNELLGSCPTCAFEKGELLFKQKKYREALAAIDRSIEDSYNQTQGGVKETYLRFLRGLCSYAILLQDFRAGAPIKEETVLEIYGDFNKALREVDETQREKIKIRTQDLVEDTNIQVPDDMERLLDLVE